MYICTPHLYTVATLPWEIQKVIFPQYYSYIYFKLFTLSQKKTNCYPLIHHTWKMSPHYLVQYATFSSDWRYVHSSKRWWLWKSRLWVSIGTTDQLHRPPHCAEIQPMLQHDTSATRPYSKLVLESIRVKKMKKMKNLCILQNRVVTFFTCGG